MTTISYIGWTWIILDFLCLALFYLTIDLTDHTIHEYFGPLSRQVNLDPHTTFYLTILLAGWLILLMLIWELFKRLINKR